MPLWAGAVVSAGLIFVLPQGMWTFVFGRRRAAARRRLRAARQPEVSSRTSLRRVNVIFDVSGKLYPLDERTATVAGESLRRKAAGQLGAEGVEGARAVADAIESVLVEASTEPIRLARERAEAMFYVLNVSIRPNDPDDADALALYVAVRDIHDKGPADEA